MNHNCRPRFLVVENHVGNLQASLTGHVVSIYKYETYEFKAFRSFQAKQFFVGLSRICRKTVESGALNSGDYDGNSTLLDVTNSECIDCILIFLVMRSF